MKQIFILELNGCLLEIRKFETDKLEMFFFPMWRKMCPDTTDSTWWYDNPYLFTNITMCPTYILSVGNMFVLFMSWSIINIFIMLSVTKPSYLQNKRVKANTLESLKFSHAWKWLIFANKLTLSLSFYAFLGHSLQHRHSTYPSIVWQCSQVHLRRK